VAAGILIAGIGNDLMGDDGLGPAAVRRLLEAYEIPPGVEVVDVGTGGFDLMDFLSGRRAAILIDAIALAGCAAGTVVRYTRQELTGSPLPMRISPHQPTLREAIVAAELLGGGPQDLVLLGVVARSFEMGEGLSGEVSRTLPELEAALLSDLKRLGVDLVPRRSEPGK
jgi:hydrogenase maturation protease